MARTDGNKVALHTLRAILDAAVPANFTIAGVTVDLKSRRDGSASYPRELAGLEPAVDGPWPPPLHVTATWATGKANLAMRVVAPGTGIYAGMVGVEVGVGRQQLLWIMLPNLLANVSDGERFSVVGHATVFKRLGEDGQVVDRLKEDQRRHLRGHGLDFKSKSVRLFDLVPPDPAPLPSAESALRNMLLTALIKMPYFVRKDPTLIEGAPLFAIAAAPAAPPTRDTPADAASEERHGGVWPLPGGVRSYSTSLDLILDWLGEAPRTRSEIADFFKERFEVTGSKSLGGYINLVVHLGVAEWNDERLEVSSEGETYFELAGDDRALYLFELFRRNFTGFIEALVATKLFEPVSVSHVNELLVSVLGTTWKTTNQAMFRRNWLLSLGLTDRDDGDSVTPLGARALAAYPKDVESISKALSELLPPRNVEPEPSSVEPEAPPATMTVELLPERVERHLGGLTLPPRLVAMASAALSVGHHLLLVGPPGTGKTELAVALAATARAEDYADGYSLVTASADWTTFDTIGGYSLEPTGGHERMVFRPGVFVSAVERNHWLVIDELNRADVDKAFGELMTVLSGRGVTTAFRLADGRTVSFGRDGDTSRPTEGWTHPITPTFRLLATMNTWDKTSLFRLSYALQRRFAILHVDVPDDAAFAGLLTNAAKKEGIQAPLADETIHRMTELFSTKGLIAHRAVGPAVALDIIRYARRRPNADGLCEALELFLLPQLEGLEPLPARKVHTVLGQVLGADVSPHARAHFDARYADLFPNLEAT